MRQRVIRARRANKPNLWSIYQKSPYDVSVFLRRALLNQYGADYRQFDAKHPQIERAAEGLRQRIKNSENAGNRH